VKLVRIAGVSLNVIATHKARTALILTAIVMGIATLTVIVSLTQGAQKLIAQRIRNFGPDAIMVHSGAEKIRGPSTADMANISRKDIGDIEAVEGVKLATPFQVELDVPVKYGNKFTTAWVFGVEPEWKDAWRRGASRGEFITETDNDQLAKVCVMGQTAAKELFGDSDPIGESVLMGHISFRIVGILEKRGQSPAGTDFDNLILIPYSTASRRMMNQPLYSSMLRIIVYDPGKANPIAARIRDVLRSNHRLAPAEEDDFRINTVEEVMEIVKGTSKTLDILLVLVAVISPIVGGIVLMNIMLIAVSERKKEIGLRRAVGAKRKQIVLQFLEESVLLTLAGGVIGVMAGVLIAFCIGRYGKPISITYAPFVLAFVLSTLIGLFFGIYPARKAASLDPATALSRG
jgi:putative ABC transport system permease protein